MDGVKVQTNASAIDFVLAITSLVIGLSHLFRPGDWCEAYRQMHRCGRPGAFVNGGLSLFAGALIVAGHLSWNWPGTIVTGFGWLLIAKSGICFLLPEVALRSMDLGARSPRGFVAGGLLFLAFSGWLWFGLWQSTARPAATPAVQERQALGIQASRGEVKCWDSTSSGGCMDSLAAAIAR